MDGPRGKIATLLFSLFALAWFCPDVFSGPVDSAKPGTEIWELQITGDTQGACKLLLRRSLTEKDVYYVTGKFSGKIEDSQWGAGLLECELKGKTRKRDFSFAWAGFAYMKEGDAAGQSFRVSGKASGSLGKNKGSGSWACAHDFGNISGKWTAKKIGERQTVQP